MREGRRDDRRERNKPLSPVADIALIFKMPVDKVSSSVSRSLVQENTTLRISSPSITLMAAQGERDHQRQIQELRVKGVYSLGGDFILFNPLTSGVNTGSEIYGDFWNTQQYLRKHFDCSM